MRLTKRILSVGVGFSLACSVAVANESGAFVGVEAGVMNSKFKDSDDALKDNVGNFGIKMGYRFTPMFRAYGAYNYATKAEESFSYKTQYVNVKSNAEISVHKFLAGFDATPEIAANTRAVVGVYGGIASLNGDYSGNFNGSHDSGSDSENGFIYGGKLGALYEIGTGEIEGGFKAEQVSYRADGDKFKQTNLGLYIGYNYKF